MSVRQIAPGATDQSIVIRIIDSADGTPETGVTSATSGLDLWYRREGAVSVDITESNLSALTDSHSDGGMLHINDGYYRVDFPDAAFAAGVAGVQIGGTATGMIVLAPYVELRDVAEAGDQMNLADDAITSGKYDESTAFPLVSADSGSTQVARVGADGDTLETLSDQIDAIAAAPGVGARAFVPTTITVTSGTGASGDADDLANDDSDVYSVNDNAGTLTLDLDYQLDADADVVQFLLIAAAQGVSDDLTIQFFDQVGSSYVTIDTISGANSLTYATFDKVVVSKYTSDAGLFQVRITGTGLGSATLTINKAVAYAVNTVRSAGYDGGYIYFDSSASNTNTTQNIDGTADNPVSSWAAVVSLQTSTGLTKLDVTGTLAPTSTLEIFNTLVGHRATLDLSASVNCGDVEIINFKEVTGTATTSGNRPVFTNCGVGLSATLTTAPAFFRDCEIGGGSFGVVFGSSGEWDFDHCSSGVAGAGTAVIDANSTDNNTLGLTDYFRGLNAQGLADNDVVTANGIFNTLDLDGATPTVNVSGQYGTLDTTGLTSASGVIATNAFKSGDIADTLADTNELQTDDVPGLIAALNDLDAAGVRAAVGLASANLDTQLDALPTAAENADAVWDEARSGHTTAGTFGEGFQGVVNGEAATGTLSTTQMTTNLTEATDDHYNGRIVVFITGVLAGQATDITDYTGSTKLITMTALTEAPSNGDRFVIV